MRPASASSLRAFLEDTAPLAAWSRGVLCGHQWLEELWDRELPGDLDDELGAVLMALTFFSSRRLAEAYLAEGQAGRPLGALAESVTRVLPEALGAYVRLGALAARRSPSGGTTGAEASCHSRPQRSVPVWQREEVQEVLRRDRSVAALLICV